MTVTTEFRPLTPQDKAAAMELFEVAFANLQERNNRVNEKVREAQAAEMSSLLDDPSASFWGYLEDDKLIGFAALTRPNAVISHYLSTTSLNVPAGIREVRSIYVYPDRQGKGNGRALIQTLLSQLEKEGDTIFCTDAGYPSSQQFWTELIGTATKRMDDYWGEGQAHMIWIARTERVLDDLHDPYRPTENTRY